MIHRCPAALGWLVAVAVFNRPACGGEQAAANRVPDASFESPVGAWLAPAVPGTCFAAREPSGEASDGKFVLAVQGWDKAGATLLSPPFPLAGDTYSGTVDVRVLGTAQGDAAAAGTTVELALFEEQGKTKVATLASATLAAEAGGAGKWTTLAASGVKLAAPAANARLGVTVAGPQRGLRLELDRLGLFAGESLGDVRDNAELTWFEAEELADGKAWRSQDHYAGWYADLPSGMKMLAGAEAVAEAENRPGVKTVAVRFPGPHRLWLRLMRTSTANRATYEVAVRQAGRVLAGRVIDDADQAIGTGDFSWAWVPLDVDVPAAGEVEVVLARPPSGSSGVARKVDLLALTNLTGYEPDIADFRPQGYVRFTNLGDAGQEPYCLWVFVHRMQPPVYYVTPGLFHAGGFTGGYFLSGDRDKWLSPGESTPWAKLSNHLVPAGNNVSFLATRASHVEGLVQDRFRGRLEFAVGDERRVVRSIEIDQAAPRLLTTLPQDFRNEPERIMTALDYVQRGEAVARAVADPDAPPAKHLDLHAFLLMGEGNDPRVVERELGVLKGLGFNGTYGALTAPQDAVAFHERLGLLPRFGLSTYYWGTFRPNAAGEGCWGRPDLAKIEEEVKKEAARAAPLGERLVRMKLSDEPSVGYAHTVSCELCRDDFRAALRARNLEPRDVGVETWEQVVPVAHGDRGRHPELFYQTGLFRLRSVADFFKACVAIKRRHLPDHVKTFVNYSPPFSWDHHGTDPFFIHRDGGLEMTWSEDWLGYGAGPQQASDTFALMRAAGAGAEPQPMGAYAVGVSGGPLLQRVKLYTLLAAGVRTINVYSYGPAYAGVDSWSTRYEIYPAVGAVLREFARIDEPLHGTTRRKSDVAILYNRTAGIWANVTSTTEQDSRYTRWALSHAGYDADFVPEEDVVAGKLAGYKVLYLNGPQVRRDAAEAIAAWVRDGGGVLFGSAGAGSRDEHDRPLATLDTVFGATSSGLKLEHDAGRPKYELRGLPVLEALTSVPGSSAPAVTFDRLCFRETLTPLPPARDGPAQAAEVILKDGSGGAAGVVHRFGKGRAVRVAAVPGIAYLHDAVSAKDYDPDSYLPKGYRPELRDFIAWPARLAGATPTFTAADAPLLEVTRYDGPGRAVLVVVDHGAAPRLLKMAVPDAAHLTRARTARGTPVTTEPQADGSLLVHMPLDATDAVVLEKAEDPGRD